MDGSYFAQPAASLKRLLDRAHAEGLTVVVFGRIYKDGEGVHDIHMNQGSTKAFVHVAGTTTTIATRSGRMARFCHAAGRTMRRVFLRLHTATRADGRPGQPP